eukprot:scaffold37761_cov49-Attheya_sp.AAC.3
MCPRSNAGQLPRHKPGSPRPVSPRNPQGNDFVLECGDDAGISGQDQIEDWLRSSFVNGCSVRDGP